MKHLFSGLLSLACSLHGAIAAQPIDSWAGYPAPSGAATPISVAFGNGVFVAVGLNGTIIYSSDGADWTLATSPTTANISRIRFMNNRFITLNPFMTSTDGANWTMVALPQKPPVGLGAPEDINPTDITFANGTYHAVGNVYFAAAPTIETSTDLANWTIQPGPNFQTIAAGNGTLVASDPSMDNIRYFDGSGWQLISDYRNFRLHVVPTEFTFQNGLFLTMRGNPPLYNHAQFLSYSSDGITWHDAFSIASDPNTTYIRRAAAGAGYYVLVHGASIYYNTVLTPTSGTDGWTQFNLDLPSPQGSSCDVAYGNNVFVAVSLGKIFRSGQLTGVESIRFAKQPASIQLISGASATLSVTVQGSDPITYQWRKNGVIISGQTSRTLALSNVSATTAGDYDVIVTNPAGNFTSDAASVVVNFAEMALYAGLTLRGNIGDRFVVEYQDDLNPATWHSLSTVTLASPTYIYIDYDSATFPGRYYRATFQAP